MIYRIEHIEKDKNDKTNKGISAISDCVANNIDIVWNNIKYKNKELTKNFLRNKGSEEYIINQCFSPFLVFNEHFTKDDVRIYDKNDDLKLERFFIIKADFYIKDAFCKEKQYEMLNRLLSKMRLQPYELRKKLAQNFINELINKMKQAKNGEYYFYV